MRLTAKLIVGSAAIAVLVLTGCQDSDPENTALPTLGSESPSPSTSPSPTADPEDVTVPPSFDVPADETTAIESAAAHVQAYQAVGAYLMNYDVEGDDRISAFAQGPALNSNINDLAYGAENRLTTEGYPEFTLQGGTAQLLEIDGQSVEFGTAQVFGCLDLSPMTLYFDGVEQERSGQQRGVYRYTVVYSPSLGHWLVNSEEYTGESC